MIVVKHSAAVKRSTRMRLMVVMERVVLRKKLIMRT